MGHGHTPARDDRFQRLIETMADGVLVVDHSGMILYTNPSALALFGRPVADMIGADFGFPLVSDQPVKIDVLPVGRAARVVALRAVETHWNGRPAWLVSLRDISDHKALEASLRADEDEKHALLGSLSEIVLYLDADQRSVCGNQAAAKFTRITKDQLIGNHCCDFWFRRNRSCDDCPVQKALNHRRPQSSEIRIGKRTLWKIRVYPILSFMDGRPGVLMLAFDITRARLMQRQIKDQEQFRTLCEMAGGIAHDYNNLLTTIDGNLELLTFDVPTGGKMHQYLGRARSATFNAIK